MSQLGERRRAKYGHTLRNDITLDKCHISAFVACNEIVKHALNRQPPQHHKKRADVEFI